MTSKSDTDTDIYVTIEINVTLTLTLMSVSVSHDMSELSDVIINTGAYLRRNSVVLFLGHFSSLIHFVKQFIGVRDLRVVGGDVLVDLSLSGCD